MTKPSMCSICGEPFKGFGHNAEPINNGRCCDECNSQFVIPVRFKRAARRAKSLDPIRPYKVLDRDWQP